MVKSSYMQLLYITNNRFPNEKANGLQIAKVCESFVEAGTNLLFVGPKRKQTENIQTTDPQKFYKLRSQIPIKQLWCLDLLQSKLLPNSTAFPLQVITFLLNFRLQRAKILKPNTIVYSRSIGVLPFIGKLNPWFFEAHTFPKTRLGQIYQKRILKKAHGIICISEGIAKKYHQLSPNIPLLIAHDAVDLKLFKNLPTAQKARQQLNLPIDKPIVLYTGSPYQWKGVFTLAEATASLKNITTIFLGGRAQESDFQKLQKSAPHALTIPFVSHDKVPLYLAAADLLVLPNSALDPISREDTSPLKLFEYLASGRNILASRVPALQTILSEKEAYFFTSDDPQNLQKQIQKIISSSSDKKTAILEKAKNHTWENRTKNILTFISQNV